MELAELLLYIGILMTVAAVLILLYATRLGKKKKEEPLRPSKIEAAEKWRYRAQQSVSTDQATEARDEVRILGLEREILSDAIRRLYEAHAEGKITEEEREQLGKRYKSRMMTIKEAIAESESLVALHELEGMQQDLVKLFDERFGELNTKIEELRSQVSLETKETIIPMSMPIPQIEAEPHEKPSARKIRKKKPSRKNQKSRKTVAEERIKKIRTEVEKVLDRLEQMEVET